MSMNTELPGDTTAATPPSAKRKENEKLSVTEAKRRFAEAMNSLDLLEPLRTHPYVVVGTAATAGAVLGSSGKVVLGLSGLVASAVRLVKPIGGIVAQIAMAKVAAHTASDQAAAKTQETVAAAAEKATADADASP